MITLIYCPRTPDTPDQAIIKPTRSTLKITLNYIENWEVSAKRLLLHLAPVKPNRLLFLIYVLES